MKSLHEFGETYSYNMFYLLLENVKKDKIKPITVINMLNRHGAELDKNSTKEYILNIICCWFILPF